MRGAPPAAAMRRCQAMNATSAVAASTSSTAACSGASPRSSTRPLSRHSVPTVAISMPRQSSCCPRAAVAPPGAVTGTNFHDSHSDARQKGTTMKKIERQPNRSTSTPPMLGPMAGASTTPMPKIPLARPCSWGSKARRMMMAGIGCTTPAASPSATRATSTSEKWSARPPSSPPASSSTIVLE